MKTVSYVSASLHLPMLRQTVLPQRSLTTTTVPEYTQHTISGSITILAAFKSDLADYTLDSKPI